MKQYLNSEQTAKLIELGFEKPWRNEFLYILEQYGYAVEKARNFSIGELIEMLPEAICESKDDSYHYFLSIETDSCLWKVFYEDECEDVLCSIFGVNLIDALYDMLTMLKKEGTI